MAFPLLPFVAFSAIVICTPGPDTALTVRNALGGGRAGGVGTAAGVAAGQLLWTVAASVGLARVLLASAAALQTIKLVGACYLVFLGARALWSAWRGRAPADGPAPARVTPVQAGRQGLSSNLANPKMPAFFLSLLPQFVEPGGAALATSLALGALFATMTFGWLAGLGLLVHRAGAVLRRFRRLIDAVSGAALVTFGAVLAFERR